MRGRTIAAGVLSLGLFAFPCAAQARVSASPCATDATDPRCIGRWSGPDHLGISCKPGGGATPVGKGYLDCTGAGLGYCTAPKWWDEIANAALIPAWNEWEDPRSPGQLRQLQGKVIVWTSCDDHREFSRSAGYRSYVIDCESEPVVKVWAPPVHGVPEGRLDERLGISSNGLLWVLDAQGRPKLLGLGGTDYRGERVATAVMPVAHQETYWFDPLAPTPDQAWSVLGAAAFPDPIWYPSLVQVPAPSATSFFVAAVGGSGWRVSVGCGLAWKVSTTGRRIYSQYDTWWVLSSLEGSWSSGPWMHPDLPGHRFQQVPRTLLKSDGDVLAIGGILVCENGDRPAVPGILGGVATQQYGTADAWSGGSLVREVRYGGNGPSHRPSLDPSVPSALLGGGQHANAVLLNTLRPGWSYRPGSYADYELDRVLIHGGTMQAFPGDSSDPSAPEPSGASIEPLGSVHEWSAQGPDGAVLREKAPGVPRTHGNFVLLPDGSVLAVGGRSRVDVPTYRSDARRFWPGRPWERGVWEELAPRNAVITAPSYGDLPDGRAATPRGYHGVALLLANGAVALMGGRHEQDPAFDGTNSLDSVEVYQPPYQFETGRLRVTGAVGPWRYGEEVEFAVSRPAQVVTVCLMGVGAVTHHFDYGQRYVELMWERASSGAIRAWIPDNPALLPPAMYLLFVVEERPTAGGVHRVPSLKGRFVKVSF